MNTTSNFFGGTDDIFNASLNTLSTTPAPTSDGVPNMPEHESARQTSTSEQSAPEESSPSPATVLEIKRTIYRMKDELDGILRLLSNESPLVRKTTHPHAPVYVGGEEILEGIFNGQKMTAADGREFHVPPNYASKSKLVEGDRMKLTITANGAFIYKQIAPVERKRIVGELTYDALSNQWSAIVDGKPYRILTASVTFYKGKPGDSVAFLVSKDGHCAWGAVENIIPKDAQLDHLTSLGF